MSVPVNVSVTDPFGVTDDPDLHAAREALVPATVRRRLVRVLQHELGRGLELLAIRVVRHKRGRRCLIEYDLLTPQGVLSVIGKVRAKGLDRRTHQLQKALWRYGFNDCSPDGIGVPEPLGIVAAFNMTLQRKVPGVPATRAFTEASGSQLARQVAEAATKLHRSNVPTTRRHTVGDELRILHEQVTRVSAAHPQLTPRLTAVLQAATALGARLPETGTAHLHRDFYPDQVLVSKDRLYLLDLDLYCQGDPALDIGNFLAHLSEQALRETGDPEAFKAQERALERHFLTLNPHVSRAAIQAYRALSLARHVAISQRLAGRRHLTARLLELSEQALGLY